MDELDRAIVNGLQGGFPLCARPYATAAQALGINEGTLLGKLKDLLEKRVLTRFGPMFDVERLGGHFSLCAMSVPAEDFERVAERVNAHPEVAHNYEREHEYNMWFVIAVRSELDKRRLLASLESETGYAILDLPREAEYFVELKLTA